MRKKATILATACVIVIVVVFFEFYVFRTPTKQTPSDTTVIDGITYSIKPTPYGRLIINYYTLLPKAESDPSIINGMLWHTAICWLLTPNEPTPPNTQTDNGSLPISLSMPNPWGEVLIDGWLYGQIPTNFTEFTMPQFSTRTFWTETSDEPIPASAQVQH